MSSPRILLLQARGGDAVTASHERACFARACGLPTERFTLYDLLDGPPSARLLEGFDAVMVGGAGDYYVSRRDLPGFDALLGFLATLATSGKPVFGSCFGYQLFVQALGGEIVYDPDRMEVGTRDLTLTDAGRADDLFSRLPERFAAQLGHKDRAVRHPDGVPNLAASEASPFQALRVPGQPVWATQFHPELRAEDNIWRYQRYLEGYGEHHDDDEQQAVIDAHYDSPHATGLLRGFIELVFGT